jgi:hypothetical protein
VTVDLGLFFPPGTSVLALPSWRRPRLYLLTRHPLQRWEQSALYPASRLRARLYRLSLRLMAAAGAAEVRTVRSDSWPLGEFARNELPQLTSAVVLMGTGGPAQEVTVQLRGEKNRLLGYLKYAEKDAARTRLRQEHFMLSNLPRGIGPEPVKFGPLGKGEALLKSVLPGKLLAATLPPPGRLIGLLDSLVVSPPVSLEAHPWVRRLRDREIPELEAWLEPLAGRNWPVVIQHGDFAPWNLLRGPDGTVRAVDWEYGTLEGFPYLDLAHFILQTSALIYRRAPLQAARYAARYLSGRLDLGLSSAEAQALTCLAAYDAYRNSSEEGRKPDAGLQPWRRAIWEGGRTAFGRSPGCL